MAARATDRKLGPTPRRRERGPVRGSTGRRVWIDNLKVLLVTLIIAIHGVLGYAGTLEVWTYTEFREVTLSPVTEGILLVLVAPFGFFMIALLFLVAGLPARGRSSTRARVGSRRTGCCASAYPSRSSSSCSSPPSPTHSPTGWGEAEGPGPRSTSAPRTGSTLGRCGSWGCC